MSEQPVLDAGVVRRDGGAVLESVRAHRVLTAGQIRRMHAPENGVRWTQKLTASLQARGLLARVNHGTGDGSIYYLTPAGAAATRPTADGTTAKVLSATQASGPLTAHTLAVNDVGIAFMDAARTTGDEFGALAWQHEIAHPLGRRGLVISDALLTYLQYNKRGEATIRYRLLELDRATLPTVRLASKLSRYARLHAYTPPGAGQPGWRARYDKFPPVICVLTGASEQVLARRMGTLLTLCEQDPLLARTPAVQIYITPLSRLRAEGPFAAIWQRPDLDHTVNWLGEPQPARRST